MRAMLLGSVLVAGVVGAAAAEPLLTLAWTRVADVPDPLGRKGLYGGVSDGHIIIAGGSNFPLPQRAGGVKQFYREVWVREVSAPAARPWRKVGTELPRPLGEGGTVTTPAGVVGVGGNDGRTEVSAVFLLRYVRAKDDVERVELPELPAKLAFAAVAEAGGWIYVAGGLGPRGAVRTFWRLHLQRALAAPKAEAWEPLAPLQRDARYGGFLVAVETTEGPRLIFGGGIGGPARSQEDYLRDVWSFDPARNRWRRGATLPRGAVGGAPLALEGGRVLLLGGSDGHDFARMRVLGDQYRVPGDVLLYEAHLDRWTVAGEMPLGLTSALAVKTDAGWLVAGGEYAPGFRTAAVHELRVSPR